MDLMTDFQQSWGILLYPNLREPLPWTFGRKKSIIFYSKVWVEAWGRTWWVNTQSVLQASASQVCLQLLVLAGSWEMREGGMKRGEDAISLSLAKYTPSGSIMDRISAGQEIILVRSRKQRVECWRVWLRRGQRRVPMGQDRVGPAALREW